VGKAVLLLLVVAGAKTHNYYISKIGINKKNNININISYKLKPIY